uniref:Galectin n=1 Tax=Canis lupus familiaris TaxID=9615 RepID=A0A8C0SAN8_CANLF
MSQPGLPHPASYEVPAAIPSSATACPRSPAMAGSSNVPHKTSLPEGIRVGTVMRIRGVVPNKAGRFYVNLLCGEAPGSEAALHFNPRLDESTVVFNTLEQGAWGREERGTGIPFQRGQPFDVLLIATDEGFKVGPCSPRRPPHPETQAPPAGKPGRLPAEVGAQPAGRGGGGGGPPSPPLPSPPFPSPLPSPLPSPSPSPPLSPPLPQRIRTGVRGQGRGRARSRERGPVPRAGVPQRGRAQGGGRRARGARRGAGHGAALQRGPSPRRRWSATPSTTTSATGSRRRACASWRWAGTCSSSP